MLTIDVRELLELFGQEQACYTALTDLSRRQKDVIESGEIDILLEILAQKQDVLERVGAIERQLSPYKGQWPLLRTQFDENDRQVLDMALATVEELLAALIAMERESEQLLGQKRDQSRRDFQKTERGAAAHQVYRGVSNGARREDRRSHVA